MTGGDPASAVHKQRPGLLRRALRLVGSTLDPRAWLHLARMVNYYNYTHVAPRRLVRFGSNPNVSPDVVFSNPTRIAIGDRVRIGSRCHIWAGPGQGHVRIGNDVLFGPEVMVTAATYRYNDGAPVTDQAMKEGDIVIGDDVWLATRALVLPGTTIGNGAIIGAGAVVKGVIPEFAIVAGSPARVVGSRNRA
jgi:acetyltransferase-like isoleucine patch superfamily enzyme